MDTKKGNSGKTFIPVTLAEVTARPTLAETVENIWNITTATLNTYLECHIHITLSQYCTA